MSDKTVRPEETESDGWWPWAICVALLLATLLNYMDRQALAVTLPTLKAKFNLAEGRVGMVEGCFGYAFAAGSLLFGWLADRMGPRLLYPMVLAGWSLAGIATSLAGQEFVTTLLQQSGDEPGTGVYRWLLICRIALGLCEAGHWPCALLTVRAILSSRHRTLGNGILQSGASIGAVLVPLYIEAAERAGQSWEFPFWSIGIAGLGWIPLWFVLIRGRDVQTVKTEVNASAEQQQPVADAARTRSLEAKPSATGTTVDFVRRIIVLMVIVSTLTISWQFLRAWLALFLQDHHGYSKQATRGLMSGYFIASDVGCILSGLIVTWLARQGFTVHGARATGFLLFALLTGCGALVPYCGDGRLMVTMLFVAGAGILGLHPYYYSLTQEISARRMGSVSGALAAVGWIVSSTSQIVLGQRIEATKSYEVGLLLVGLAPMLGFVCLLLLWPKDRTHGK
ncbi:MAG: MFS transporter [Planctomycetaceae bacterium]